FHAAHVKRADSHQRSLLVRPRYWTRHDSAYMSEDRAAHILAEVQKADTAAD
ncbi:unnamed protein product, partial [Amoebophrya sp. A25]